MIEIDGKIYRNLEEQVRKNKEDIESIDTSVTSNTNAIAGINTRLDNLDLTYATDQDIQNLQSQINTKAEQSALNSTNSQVSTNTSNISSLSTTKANQSDLNSTNSRVGTLESTVTQLSPQVAKSLKTPMSAPSSTELVAIDTSNGQAMISIGAGLVIENDTLKSTGGVQIVDNLTSTSISAALSANQGRVLSNTISTVTSSVDSNTEQIELLQSDMAGKTNVTINNVHQDYINFSSDPQTQLDNKLDTSGGTMAGDIKLPAGKFLVDANGYGLVGYYGTGSTTYGNGYRGINLRGNATRPQYNSSDIAMLSDVTQPKFSADSHSYTSSGYTTYMSIGGDTWYILFPTGLKICHLSVTVPSSDSAQQVTLPIAFKTVHYMVNIQRSSGSSYVRLDDIGCTDKTTSGFKIRGYNSPALITCIGY